MKTTSSSEPKRLPLLLRRAWYGLNQAFRRRILHIGITPDQFTVLRTLHEHGRTGMTQTRLTETMSSDPNTIASLLARMEAGGLIQRMRCPEDRRAKIIHLKSLGRRRFGQARRIALGLQHGIMEKIPGARREHFLDDLFLVAEACQRAAGGTVEAE